MKFIKKETALLILFYIVLFAITIVLCALIPETANK